MVSEIGLLKHKNWSRVTIVVMSILGLLNLPSSIMVTKLKQSLGIGYSFIDFLQYIMAVFFIWFLIVLFNKDVKAMMSKNAISANQAPVMPNNPLKQEQSIA